jgi:hypothetical protein
MTWVFRSTQVCSVLAAQFATVTETSVRSSHFARLCLPRTCTNPLSSAPSRPSTSPKNAYAVAFSCTSVPDSTFFVHAGKSNFTFRNRGFVQHDV